MKILITGSADGLGQMAARILAAQGHEVVLHARSAERAREAKQSVPKARSAVWADLSSIDETKELAEKVNALGVFDAIIHNAAVGYREPRRIETIDGLAHVFAVNSLAPYLLTALIHRPRRLVYLSSTLHRGGDPSLEDLNWTRRPWNGSAAYSDSKLHDAILSCAVARYWPDVYANAVEPGWVPTKMGGKGATDDLEAGPQTQVWLAVGEDPGAKRSGGYFYHLEPREPIAAVHQIDVQDKFLKECERISGVPFPR